MELTITTNPSPERYVVSVAGEIDISNATSSAMPSTWLWSSLPTASSSISPRSRTLIRPASACWWVLPTMRPSVVAPLPSREPANVVRVVQLLGVDKDIDISAV